MHHKHSHATGDPSFHRVLAEAVSPPDGSAEFFYTKVQHLNWMLESIAADIRQPGQVQGAIDKAHQLIPIQKFLSSLKNDVKETCAAIQTVRGS